MQLKALGNEKMRGHNTRNGAGDKQVGVKHGDIRVLAKKIKAVHKLALYRVGLFHATVAPQDGQIPGNLANDRWTLAAG